MVKKTERESTGEQKDKKGSYKKRAGETKTILLPAQSKIQ